MDRDPTVERDGRALASERSLSRRLFEGNGQIILASVLLMLVGGTALSVALETETAMARILGQQDSEGFRQITIEFEHDGELYNLTDRFDVEGIQEGDVVRVWFDGNDPEFVEFSKTDLFVGFSVIIALLLIWLGIAIVRRGRARRPGRRRRRRVEFWESMVEAQAPAQGEADRPESP